MGIELKLDINRFMAQLCNFTDEFAVGEMITTESLNIYRGDKITLLDTKNGEIIEVTGAVIGGWINKLRMKSGSFSSDGRKITIFDDNNLNQT